MSEPLVGEVVIDDYPFRRWLVKGSIDLPNYKVLIEYLVAKYKNCYYCGVPVKIYPQIDGKRTPDDRATIEHLTARPSRKRHDLSVKVLACHKCNNERGKLTHKGLAP